MLREVLQTDLPVFYAHQRDPLACEMAAFKPREEQAFFTHWKTKVLVPSTHVRTIVHDGQIAGYVSTYASGNDRLVAYWVGREFWGRGLASRALQEFVKTVDTSRPLDAFVATSNIGSIRVLEKAGFRLVPDSRSVGDDGVEEVSYQLK